MRRALEKVIAAFRGNRANVSLLLIRHSGRGEHAAQPGENPKAMALSAVMKEIVSRKLQAGDQNKKHPAPRTGRVLLDIVGC